MRTFLVSWKHGNNAPKLMMVEAETGWQAKEIAIDYINMNYSAAWPEVHVLEYLIRKEDNDVEDVS